jgi:hypothetical protein
MLVCLDEIDYVHLRYDLGTYNSQIYDKLYLYFFFWDTRGPKPRKNNEKETTGKLKEEWQPLHHQDTSG